MLIVKFLELRQEIIGQGLSSLMSREIVIFLVINYLDEKLFEDVELIFL